MPDVQPFPPGRDLVRSRIAKYPSSRLPFQPPFMALVPAEVIAHSPSASAGIPHTQEKLYRVFACQMVQDAGILLRLYAVFVGCPVACEVFGFPLSTRASPFGAVNASVAMLLCMFGL